MRDIRQDLKDRIAEFDTELERLDKRAETIRDLRGYYVRMLDAEEARWGQLGVAVATNGSAPHTATDAGRERTPLAKFILECVEDGEIHSERNIADLAIERQFPFGNKNPLKVVHFACLGMGQNGQLVKSGTALWRKGGENQTAQRS